MKPCPLAGDPLRPILRAAMLRIPRLCARGNKSFSITREFRQLGAERCPVPFHAAASQRDAATPRPTDLSAREQEVLALVAQGKSNKEIGAAIAIAENTVKNHLKSILDKLHLGDRVLAATYAFRQGLAGQGE